MAQDQVAEVKEKTDIVALIGERIELKRAGRNFKASCPFHDEKTASFMVSPELQMYKCFGCGEAGDVYTFLEKYEGMEFPEALKFLADRAGVKLTRQVGQARGEKEKLYEACVLAQRFYSYVLTKHPSGKDALEYLTQERGITAKTFNEFGLGYCPSMPFAARKFLVEKHKIPVDDIVAAGIAYKGQRGVFDRFRGRVIFPLYDHRGNPVGFAGRVLPGASHDLAKYINTPETLIYHKGSLLYGLNLSRSEIKRSSTAVIVEGELDMIACYQAGIKNVVAIKGTALTEDQIRLISRYAGKIIIALDADIAGDAAARRGITIASNLGLEVAVLRLDKYKDPDEAVRADPEYFKKALENPVGVWDFIIDSAISRYGAESGVSKSKVSRELVPILASIEDKIVQVHYAKILADKLDVPVEAVTTQISGNSKPPTLQVVDNKPASKTRRELLESRLISLLIVRTNPKVDIGGLVELFVTVRLKRIAEELARYLEQSDKFVVSEFAEGLPPELQSAFSDLVMVDYGEDEIAENEFSDTKRDLEKEILKAKRTELTREMKELEKSDNSEGLEKAEKEYIEITRKLSALEE